MPHPKLAAGASGAAHAHGLQVEDVDLEEVAAGQFEFHHHCPLLGFKVYCPLI